MSSPRSLTIGSFVAVNRDGADFRHVPRWTGWDDSPAIRFSMPDQMVEDGAWDDPVAAVDERVIAIDGVVDQTSHAAAIAIRNELANLRPRTLYTITADDGVDVRWVQARVTKGAVFEWVTDVMFRYSIELTAPYPHKRAVDPVVESIAAGTSPSLTNDGSVAAEVEITTTSSGTVVLTAAGLTLETTTLPSGTVLTSGPGFANDKWSVVGPSGEDLFSAMVPGYQWPAVSPGSGVWASTGTANVDVTYYPTYP